MGISVPGRVVEAGSREVEEFYEVSLLNMKGDRGTTAADFIS